MRIDIAGSEMFSTIFESITHSKFYHPITGLTNDSRQVKKGDLYIAINGDNNNGHDFLNEVSEKGAAAALVNKPDNNFDIQQIQVIDTINTLKKVAIKWRKNFDIPIIAITGSNGKTTSKDLLLHILSSNFKVHATKGNFNTAIGLCFTMFGLQSYHDLAIVELGASMPGEIKNLCDIALPTHGLITNISPAHLEGFGSIENIAKEKGDLFRALRNGTCFVNMADDYISKIDIKGEKISFGLTPHCNFPADIFQEKDGTLTLILDTHEIKTNSHNFSFLKNCIAVSAIAITLGLKSKILNDRLQSFSPSKGRCFVSQRNNITIIDDTYNANLVSSLAALDYLNAFSNEGRKIFVFGDMLELGNASKEQHAQIGTKCSDLEIDIVYTIGDHTTSTDSNIKNGIIHEHFQSKDFMINSIKTIIKKGDKILFKGSRSMEMEKIIEGVFEN